LWSRSSTIFSSRSRIRLYKCLNFALYRKWDGAEAASLFTTGATPLIPMNLIELGLLCQAAVSLYLKLFGNSSGDNFSPCMPCQWYVRGGGEGPEMEAADSDWSVRSLPPQLEWHSDVLSCGLRIRVLCRVR
jgi:hypothetical protein